MPSSLSAFLEQNDPIRNGQVFSERADQYARERGKAESQRLAYEAQNSSNPFSQILSAVTGAGMALASGGTALPAILSGGISALNAPKGAGFNPVGAISAGLTGGIAGQKLAGIATNLPDFFNVLTSKENLPKSTLLLQGISSGDVSGAINSITEYEQNQKKLEQAAKTTALDQKLKNLQIQNEQIAIDDKTPNGSASNFSASIAKAGDKKTIDNLIVGIQQNPKIPVTKKQSLVDQAAKRWEYIDSRDSTNANNAANRNAKKGNDKGTGSVGIKPTGGMFSMFTSESIYNYEKTGDARTLVLNEKDFTPKDMLSLAGTIFNSGLAENIGEAVEKAKHVAQQINPNTKWKGVTPKPKAQDVKGGPAPTKQEKGFFGKILGKGDSHSAVGPKKQIEDKTQRAAVAKIPSKVKTFITSSAKNRAQAIAIIRDPQSKASLKRNGVDVKALEQWVKDTYKNG